MTMVENKKTSNFKGNKKMWMRIPVALLLVCLYAHTNLGCSLFSMIQTEASVRMPAGSPEPAPSGGEWVSLLEGDHAAHWANVSDNRDIFTIEDGVLHIPGQTNTRYVAYTHQVFEDFELHVEFRLEKSTNSGVFIRSSLEDPVYAGMEIQVIDDHGSLPSNQGSGALYDVATPMFNLSLPAGEWNSMRIRCERSTITVHMNGWKVLEVDLDLLTMPVGKFDTPLAELPRTGYLLLQDHGGEIWYRNILLKTL